MLNEPRLRKANKLWAGGETKKKPAVSLVSSAGRERNVNGVLMGWFEFSAVSTYITVRDVRIEVYLIDIDSGEVYRAKGNLKKADVLLDKVVSQFLTDNPKVVP